MIATAALFPLQESDFPPEYQGDAKLILSMHLKGRQEGGAGQVWWNFDRLSPREREVWTALLIRMYACFHQDIGRFAPESADLA